MITECLSRLLNKLQVSNPWAIEKKGSFQDVFVHSRPTQAKCCLYLPALRRQGTPQQRESQTQSSTIAGDSETIGLSGDHSQRPSPNIDPKEYHFNSNRSYAGRGSNEV